MQPAGSVLQAAGHAGNLRTVNEDDSTYQGFILKLYDEAEAKNYEKIWNGEGEPLQQIVARWGGTVDVKIGSADAGETATFMRLGNLLEQFKDPCVMDCKMGCRTFQETEAKNSKPRPDLYKRLNELTPEYLSSEDHAAGHITKFKWMVSRDAASTSGPLGFRIDGIVSQSGARIKKNELDLYAQRDQVLQALPRLLPLAVPGQEGINSLRIALVHQIITQLERSRQAMEASLFFQSHEFVGSSLLFVVDSHQARVHFIDLAKTTLVPDGILINHRGDWKMGNHEDSLLRGVDNLIECWQIVMQSLECSVPAVLFDDMRMQELEKKLQDQSVDTTSWGFGGAKSIQELYSEIHDERAVAFEKAEDGRFFRVMEVVKAWILVDIEDRGKCALMEPKKHCKFTTDKQGSLQKSASEGLAIEKKVVKTNGKPLQKKVSQDQRWQDALVEAIEERLGISPASQGEVFDIQWHTYNIRIDGPRLGTEKDGYLGLWSKYRVHEIDVLVKDLRHSLLARLGLPDGGDFTVVNSAGLHSAFGQRQHFWSWLPADQCGYVPNEVRNTVPSEVPIEVQSSQGRGSMSLSAGPKAGPGLKPSAVPKDVMKDVFKSFDVSNTGRLSRDVFCEALKKINPEWTEADMSQVFSRIETSDKADTREGFDYNALVDWLYMPT